jgi:hypothetical protein
MAGEMAHYPVTNEEKSIEPDSAQQRKRFHEERTAPISCLRSNGTNAPIALQNRSR